MMSNPRGGHPLNSIMNLDTEPKGTPATLWQAIINGYGDSHEPDADDIEKTVVDFLNQRFCAAMLKADGNEQLETALYELLESITGRPRK